MEGFKNYIPFFNNNNASQEQHNQIPVNNFNSNVQNPGFNKSPIVYNNQQQLPLNGGSVEQPLDYFICSCGFQGTLNSDITAHYYSCQFMQHEYNPFITIIKEYQNKGNPLDKVRNLKCVLRMVTSPPDVKPQP